MMAHQMWSKLGASSHDYNFTFQTPTTDALYELLPVEERLLIKVGTSASPHSWKAAGDMSVNFLTWEAA